MRIVWTQPYGIQVGNSPEEIIDYRGVEGDVGEVPDDIGELLISAGAAKRDDGGGQEPKRPAARRQRKT